MKLVDAQAVRDVLTDNVDEHVSQFVVFTTHGTLLSTNSQVLKRDLIKFTPFAGTVWRNHQKQLNETDQTNLDVGGLREMRTVGFKVSPPEGSDGAGGEEGEGAEGAEGRGGGKALVQLTVEMDGWVSVVRCVSGRLLVAARLEVGKLEGKGEVGEGEGVEGLSLEEDGSGSVDRRSDSAGSDGNEGDDGGREDENDASVGSPARSLEDGDEGAIQQSNGKPSKMRILELKAEGMAEFLADEYPAKLPHDFY